MCNGYVHEKIPAWTDPLLLCGACCIASSGGGTLPSPPPSPALPSSSSVAPSSPLEDCRTTAAQSPFCAVRTCVIYCIHPSKSPQTIAVCSFPISGCKVRSHSSLATILRTCVHASATRIAGFSGLRYSSPSAAAINSISVETRCRT